MSPVIWGELGKWRGISETTLLGITEKKGRQSRGKEVVQELWAPRAAEDKQNLPRPKSFMCDSDALPSLPPPEITDQEG